MQLIIWLRQQHDELMVLLLEYSRLLSERDVAQSSMELRGLITRIAGKLKIHYAMEDHSLYQPLLAHPDAAIRALARSFQAEVGHLAAAFQGFLDRWPSSVAIRADVDGFRADSEEVISSVVYRILRENEELYPPASLAMATETGSVYQRVRATQGSR
ncbi:MAG: hemerythrin domain-containing protein [Pseudomonadota bacterium]